MGPRLMKYYYEENILRYERFKAEGKTAWSEILKDSDFENFSSRAFLGEVLPRLRFSSPRPTALEYGCGTGPGACFLAERGFQVDGIDIIPIAIEIAKQFAKDRNLNIHYEVQDICELPHEGKKYDMIVDSYCLQGIVTDEDRESVFSAVRARLKAEGYYLVSTAMFDKDRFSNELVLDAESGIVYNRYGEDGLMDARNSIVYEKLEGNPGNYEGTIKIEDTWYLLNRRHLKAQALRAELEAAGFSVLYQSGEYGENAVCVLQDSSASLRPASGGKL
jgi:SAM-dependent methyltransferase